MQLMIRNKAKLAALAATIGTVVLTAFAVQDRNFWTEAAQSGMAEVALGNLAAQKAQSDRVKQFGEQMVRDHTAVNDELKSLASGKSVTLPTDVSPKQKATYDRLSGLSGADFDREFMKVMVKDHEAAVKLFDKQSRSDGDAEAKAFAAKNLPALQGHLQTAQSINGEIKNSKSGKGDNSHGSGHNSNSNSNSN